MAIRCVVLADVVRSSNVPDRQQFDRELHRTLESIGDDVGESLDAPFETMKGVDEFGGSLRDFGHVYRVIRRIHEGLHPVEIRFAASVGEVDVNPDGGDIGRMDGPALHEGTALLDALKRSGRRFGIHYPAGTANPMLEDVVNLLLFTKEDWTERQLEIVSTYRNADTMTEAAEELGVSVQRVSKALQTTYGTQLLEIEARVNREFETLGEEEVNATIRSE